MQKRWLQILFNKISSKSCFKIFYIHMILALNRCPLSTFVFIGRVRHNLFYRIWVEKSVLLLHCTITWLLMKSILPFWSQELKKSKYFSLTVGWLLIVHQTCVQASPEIMRAQFFSTQTSLVCMKCLLIPWDPQSNLNKVQLLRTLWWQSYKSINSHPIRLRGANLKWFSSIR